MAVGVESLATLHSTERMKALAGGLVYVCRRDRGKDKKKGGSFIRGGFFLFGKQAPRQCSSEMVTFSEGLPD
jgi:hypothetical protein